MRKKLFFLIIIIVNIFSYISYGENVETNTQESNNNIESNLQDGDSNSKSETSEETLGESNTNEDITNNTDSEMLDTTSIDNQKENDKLMEILNKRKEELKKVLEKSEAEKQQEEEAKKKRLLEIQKEIIKELNLSLEKEIRNIKESIDKNNKVINDLKKEKTTNVELNNRIKELEKQNTGYLEKINNLTETIKKNNEEIYNLNIALNNQELLLKKAVELKTELEEQKNNVFIGKLERIGIIGLVLFLLYIIFTIIEFFYIKKTIEKKRDVNSKILSRLNGVRTILSLSFVIYIIIALFYLFPEYIFVLFFALSALLVILSPIIGSYLSTILLLGKINIGDRITFPKTKTLDGIITNIGLVNLEIRKISNNRITNESINIATRQLFLEPYILVSKFIDSKTIKLGGLKEGNIVEKIEKQEINVVTKLKNEYLSRFLNEIKEILKKIITSKIDENHNYIMEYKIKDIDTMNINIFLKSDIDTANKIRLKIFNTMYKYEQEQEQINKEKENNENKKKLDNK